MTDEPERLIAATIYLMSCHARTRCPRLALMVERHLALIGRCAGTSMHVRETCRRRASAWVAIRAHDEAESSGRAHPIEPRLLH